MRTGLFCTYENPGNDYKAAYTEQTKLVQLIEALGFDDAWVAEHHFNPGASSSSCLNLLTYLAACTTRIRLGSAAVLLPFHDPIRVAEDVATLDILSGGRFDFGVAKGGPFAVQNKHFGVNKDESRARACEALAFIQKILTQDGVCFNGDFFKADDLSLTPKPVQNPIPTFVATSTADMVRVAAKHNYGIMAGPPFPLDVARDNLRVYRETARHADPKLVLIRFYHLAPTHQQAVEEAKVLLGPFQERMRAQTAIMQPEWVPWFNIDRMIKDSLIGTPAEVRDKVLQIEIELQPRSLILKPVRDNFAQRRVDLRVFAETIRPMLGSRPEPALRLQ